MEGVWQKAADRIRESLGQVGYETWIGPLNFIGLQDRMATIEAPNRFFRDWVNERYLELMRQVLSAELGETVEVKLVVGKDVPGGNLPAGNGNGHSQKANPAKRSNGRIADGGIEHERTAHPHLNP